jgi:thiamine kinase-like enzyme
MPEETHHREPAELESRVRQLLAADEATRSLAGGNFVPLHGGQSNHAWRVELRDCAWSVRLNAADAARLGVDRSSECRLLGIAAAAGLAPAVLRCDPQAGLLVCRFLEGRSWTREDFCLPENLGRLGGLLRRLHELPASDDVQEVSFEQQARRLESEVPEERLPVALGAQSGKVFDRLAVRQGDCLCHNDLHHLNVVDDGERLWLVDWEYGGRGDPLYDLASCLCQHPEPRSALAGLLPGYGGSLPGSASELEDACWAFDYVRLLWYLAQDTPGEEISADFRAIAGQIERSLEHRMSRA